MNLGGLGQRVGVDLVGRPGGCLWVGMVLCSQETGDGVGPAWVVVVLPLWNLEKCVGHG